MPEIVEERLAREADEKGLTGEHKQAYIYGTMQKMGLLHKKSKPRFKFQKPRSK